MREIIDTGLVEFVLPFDRGEEKIYFNPNDIDFFVRMQDMINDISKLYEDLADRYESVKDADEKIEIVRELNTKIKNAFDVGFGNKVSDIIFKYVSPNGIVKSKKQYYAFYIIDYLLPMIKEETGKTSKETQEALEKAMNKHAVKYQHKFS